jgi:hypothetical protein
MQKRERHKRISKVYWMMVKLVCVGVFADQAMRTPAPNEGTDKIFADIRMIEWLRTSVAV